MNKLNSLYQSGSPLIATSSQSSSFSNATCSYTFTLNSKATLLSINSLQLPFPVSNGKSRVNTNILPYLVYNANITNPLTSNNFNTKVSYEVYSPSHYASPQGNIDPFSINSMSMLFGNYTGSSLTYFSYGGVGTDTSSANNAIGITQTYLQSVPGTGGGFGSCPNKDFYGQSTTLTLQQVVDCGIGAGFSGPLLITFVSMAYQESNFNPAAIEPGPHAEGILQEGCAGQSPPSGCAFPVGGYNPNSCSTYNGNWGSIYFNPQCAFQWAKAYYDSNGYAFWGSYLSGDYCKWAPSGFLGTGSVTCSGSNQNQANLPWSTVCPNNVCQSSGGSGGGGGGGSPGSGYAYPVGKGCTFARIDQGVDWTGACPLYAVGSGTVTIADSTPTQSGWPPYPDGTFIEIKLDNPLPVDQLVKEFYPGYAACATPTNREYVYYAETINSKVSLGEHVSAGQVIGYAVPNLNGQPGVGIELGWGNPSGNIDNTLYQWVTCNDYLGSPYNNAGATPQGQDFYNFINGLSSQVTTTTSVLEANTINIDPGSIASIPSGYVFAIGNDTSVPADPSPSLSGAPQYPINLYTLYAVPKGDYNFTGYTPNTVQQASDQATFNTNWNSYWNNTMYVQNKASLYVVNAIPLSMIALDAKIPQTGAICQYVQCPASPNGNFIPMNITSDSSGDIFMIGTDPVVPAEFIIRITNVTGGGKIHFSSEPLCPAKTASQIPSQVCSNGWPEIAVSPNGAQVYLANQNSGYMPIFTGPNLTYSTSISLDYSNDQALYPQGGGLQSPTSAPPVANVIDYLQYGGLYNITTQCGGSGQASCTEADKIMKNIINQEKYDTGGWNSSTYDMLDKAQWPSGNPNSNYHHPLAIQDINGYLYVLDYWSGVMGEICTGPIDLFGHHYCGSGSSVGGIKVGMLTLRIINSSGVDIPIQPTYYNDLWYCNSVSVCNYLTKYTQSSSVFYPPFGWVITANVSSNQPDQSETPYQYNGGAPGTTSAGETLNLCGGNPTPPSGTAPCLQPGSNYHGSYLPIGPELSTDHCNHAGLGVFSGCEMSKITGASLSVSYNDTVSIAIPNASAHPQLTQGSGNGKRANLNYDELILAQFPPQNYTRQIGGNNPLPFNLGTNWRCYTSATSESDKHGGACAEDKGVANLLQPTYLMANPFEYDENIGSFQALTLQEVLSSSFNPSSSAATKAEGINNPQLVSGFNQQLSSEYSGSTQAPVTPTRLYSQLQGYLLEPYSYTYSMSYYLSNIVPSSSNPPSCPSNPSSNPAVMPASGTYSVYNFTTSKYTKSNTQNAIVESAPMYAQSTINTSRYYIPLINAIIAPQELYYDLLTNRIFGDIYVNETLGSRTNAQAVVNSSDQLKYSRLVYSQGTNPGFEAIGTTQIKPACIGPLCSSPQLTAPNIFKLDNNFSTPAHKGAPVLVTLFNWYKVPVYDSGLYLGLNGSSGAKSVYGYHRVIFAYNDRFNNTIYMPLDVDIANITQINLTVVPTVNPTNANQTTITVNGTAYWVPPFSTQSIPLKNGKVYLYYDANLNTIGYNAVYDPVAAQTCAFSNATQPKSCDFANPVYNGLQSNPADPQFINANVITYHTSYNSTGSCSPPPNSLLAPASQLYTLCNIYNKGQPASCPASSIGNTQYCLPIFNNGTGLCTSQVGLFSIATTNSMGYFSSNIVACGYGLHNIIAQYYGTPGPEPIYALQSPMGLAADPSVPASQSISFQTFNYSWSPIQASATAAIGTILLSVGNISALIGILVIAALFITLAMLKSRTTSHTTGHARKNRGPSKHK